MAESLQKLILLSNKRESVFDEEIKRILSESDEGNSNQEINQDFNLHQVEILFSELKVSKDQLKTIKEMDISELSETSINSSQSELEDTQFCLAGETLSIFENLLIVLVQPSRTETTLLNIGTNLYFRKSKLKHFETNNCTLLGQVEDIFGNVNSPLYAVRLSSSENNLVKVRDQIYYLSTHSSTSLFHVESVTTDKYSVIHHG